MEWCPECLVYLYTMLLPGGPDPVPEAPFLLAGASATMGRSWGYTPAPSARPG